MDSKLKQVKWRLLNVQSVGNKTLAIYNRLPNSVKNSENLVIFKKKLKTYLFSDCYNLVDKTLNETYRI